MNTNEKTLNDWLDTCIKNSHFGCFKDVFYEDELKAARAIYTNEKTRQFAHDFLNHLQVVANCDEAESQMYRQKGNECFRNPEGAQDAAILYTRAIYKAPNGSEALGLAHGNRAAALYKLGEMEAAILDCELALEFNHPKVDVIRKRQAVISKSLPSQDSKMIESGEKPEMLPLREGRSCLFSPNGKKLKILKSADQGRYVVADEPINVNETILVENAHVHVPSVYFEELRRTFLKSKDTNIKFACDNCVEDDIVPFPCYECRSVFYCSKKCQKEHGPIHQMECSGYKLYLFGEMPGAHLAFRSFLAVFDKLLRELCALGDVKDYKEAEDLWPIIVQSGQDGELLAMHLDFKHIQKEQDIIRMGMEVTLVCCYLIHRTEFFSRTSTKRLQLIQSEFEWEIIVLALLVRLWCQHSFCSYNCGQIISKKAFSPLSTKPGGLFNSVEIETLCTTALPRIGLLNHSCDPAVEMNISKLKVTLVCKRPLCKGDEICLSYIGYAGSLSKNERRDYLWRLFGFKCMCSQCAGHEDPIYKNANRMKCNRCDANIVWDKTCTCSHCGCPMDAEFYLRVLSRSKNIKDSVQKYKSLYQSLLTMEDFLPRGTVLWQKQAISILANFFKSNDVNIRSDSKANDFMLKLAVNLLKSVEINSCHSLSYILATSILLDIIALLKENGLRWEYMEYDLMKVKQSFKKLSGKVKERFERYYKIYVE